MRAFMKAGIRVVMRAWIRAEMRAWIRAEMMVATVLLTRPSLSTPAICPVAMRILSGCTARLWRKRQEERETHREKETNREREREMRGASDNVLCKRINKSNNMSTTNTVSSVSTFLMVDTGVSATRHHGNTSGVWYEVRLLWSDSLICLS